MKAHFGRKVVSMAELKELTNNWIKAGEKVTPYEVIKEISLSDQEFQAFAEDLLADQLWIDKRDGGSNQKGEVRCIRVINQLTGERMLINNEGFDYPRYTAIETREETGL